MNSCLHQRYKFTDTSMGCDSYWMDTLHTNRKFPSMGNNNEYRKKKFASSKASLVCGKDVMKIGVSGNIPVKLHETVLITTILWDWNIRAWTSLETFQARQSICLICKDNKTISLRESAETASQWRLRCCNPPASYSLPSAPEPCTTIHRSRDTKTDSFGS